MYCILNPNVALRSWWLVPWAYYIKGNRNAIGLKKEEFDLLSLCDGKHDLEETPLLTRFLSSGMVFAVSPDENAELSPWQKRECDNRYFPAMNWMITGKCNYNCLHCFNASDNAPLMSEFSLDEAERLLDEAEACGINAFTITGGEPMAHKHFFEILESIYRRGMFVEELNTNGYYIDQTALDRMSAIGCRPLIKISFDGIGHHDWLRNKKGAEEDALRAIRLCVKKRFRVKAQTNVHRWNLDSMLPTLKLLDSIGVEETRIIRTTEVPRWNQNAAGATLELHEYFDEMLADTLYKAGYTNETEFSEVGDKMQFSYGGSKAKNADKIFLGTAASILEYESLVKATELERCDNGWKVKLEKNKTHLPPGTVYLRSASAAAIEVNGKLVRSSPSAFIPVRHGDTIRPVR